MARRQQKNKFKELNYVCKVCKSNLKVTIFSPNTYTASSNYSCVNCDNVVATGEEVQADLVC